ncbi:carboxypeptidase-like regulatory domain-containing protein [Aquabacterium humicola]|uniref:carboxypeptidase-like regulatory domain-containing protein n=1 Tax=Aquabacterium humicola TaxID=3237377 RepID=UPI00254315DB|nr:carboxypeptidase-like regulatory domain-containing protein [Rubrivivax pictus]
MSRFVRPMLPVLFGLVAVMLGSCGGGGGGDAPPPPPPPPACAPIPDSTGGSLACDDPFWGTAPGGGPGGADGDSAGADGTAGDGRAIPNAAVTLTDAGGQTRSATTDAQGYYRINITRFTPPFVLKLVTADGEERHHAFSTQAVKKRGFITINITGLTDKLASDLAIAGGQSGARNLTPAIVTAQSGQIPTVRTNLTQTIRNQITAAGLNPDTFDPITQFFRPNLQGHDLVLETVAVYIDNNGATQVVPKVQSACTAPRRWVAGGNVCTTSNSPGFIPSGTTGRFNDSSAPLVGSADFSCSNGTLTPVGTPTCAAPVNQPCNAPTASWTVGASSCTSDAAPGGLASGQSLTLTDSQSPTTGSITYACSNGSLSQTGTATCSTSSTTACAAPSATWSVGGTSCQSANTPTAMSSGTQQTLTDSTAPSSGSITYACTGGNLSVQGTPSCALTSGSCAAPPGTWTTGSATCTADQTPQPLANQQAVELADTTGPDTGNAGWICRDGRLSPQSIPFCQTTVPSACNAPSRDWQVEGRTCSADVAPTGIASGSTATLTDNTSPNVGAISYACSNGTLTLTGSPSCAAVTTSTCSTAGLANSGWTVGNNTCTPDSVPTSVASGSTIVLTDSNAPSTGKLTLQCMDGALITVGETTCTAPPVAQACTANVKNWNDSTFVCSADEDLGDVLIPSGSSFTWIDSLGPFVGSRTLACSNGTLNVVNSNCSFFTGGPSSAPKATAPAAKARAPRAP